MKHTHSPSKHGFTLIELLATLSIMAIISMMLWPHFGNYRLKAQKTSDLQALRVFEDAMDRYRALNLFLDESTWGSAQPNTTGDIYLLSAAYRSNIIDDITDPGPNQTLKTGNTITTDNVMIVRSGPAPAWEWMVMYYREETNRGGIDRNGNYIEETDFLNPSAADINAVF